MKVIHLPHEVEPQPPAMELATVAPAVVPVDVREVCAVRTIPPAPVVTPMDKHERRTVFALGAAAGIAVALCFYGVLTPRIPQTVQAISGTTPTAAVPVGERDLPTLIQVQLTRGPITIADLPVALPTTLVQAPPPPARHAVVTPRPKVQPRVAIALPLAALQSPKHPAPKVSAFDVATVMYRAPGSSPSSSSAPAGSEAPMQEANVPSVTKATHLTVVSIPSATLALIGAQIDGSMMVSPYKVGQKLPDGRVITALEPATGTVQTTAGYLTAGQM